MLQRASLLHAISFGSTRTSQHFIAFFGKNRIDDILSELICILCEQFEPFDSRTYEMDWRYGESGSDDKKDRRKRRDVDKKIRVGSSRHFKPSS